MKNKFSIIIPAYNCEKTIEKTIESVLNQKYSLYEIIIVNDGSKDNTGDVLKKYSSNKNVKIINKKNSGVSDTRNIAIENSSNEWLLFLDADDWIEEGSLSYLNDVINDYEPDFIITPLIYSNKRGGNILNRIIDDKKNIIDNIICLEYSDKKYNGEYKNCRCIGGKLVRKSVILNNNIKFPSGIKKFEDGIFCLNVAISSKRVLYSTYQFYNYYYDNPNSRMNTFNKDDLSESYTIFNKIEDILKNNGIATESIDYLAFFMFIISVDNIMHLNTDKDKTKMEIKKAIEFYYPYFKNIKYKYLNIKKKIELLFAKQKNINFLYNLYFIKIKLLKK